MPSEYCFATLCFVPLTEPSPGIFGLCQQFVPGLALMALASTTADARYRFRVASAALPVRTVTFVVLAIVGPLGDSWPRRRRYSQQLPTPERLS